MKLGDNSFFETAFKYSPIGMAILSLTGDWLLVNPALCTLLHYSRDEFLRVNWKKFTHPDDLENDLKNMKKLLNNQVKSVQMEKRYFTKNGGIIWGLLSVTLIKDEFERPMYFIAQIQDLTENKKNERKVAEAEKMATLYEMSVLLAHEVNNPLTIISINCEILRQLMNEKYTDLELSRKIVRKIQEATERVRLLVKDLQTRNKEIELNPLV